MRRGGELWECGGRMDFEAKHLTEYEAPVFTNFHFSYNWIFWKKISAYLISRYSPTQYLLIKAKTFMLHLKYFPEQSISSCILQGTWFVYVFHRAYTWTNSSSCDYSSPKSAIKNPFSLSPRTSQQRLFRKHTHPTKPMRS